jgi:hypothetical protein
MKITNNTNVSLPLAVWAVADDYDYDPDPLVISTTGIIKPMRSIILDIRAPSQKEVDVTDLIASSMGSALHNDIEYAWKNHYREAMLKLGYPEHIIDKIVINPEEIPFPKNTIAIYMERRSKKKLGKFTISGKFDLVMEAKLHDYKSTSVWGWIYGGNEEDYILQGSIYRWLNQDIITQDTLDIQYIFTDWSAVKARQDRSYPQQRVATKTYKLMPITETEHWLTERLQLIEGHLNAPLADLPLCTAKELWQKDPVYKYYKNPASKTRATKNFDNMADAITRQASDKNVGEIVTVLGEVKRCIYCSAINSCTQAENLIATGVLKI